jgi:hypothetical protein
VVDVILEQAELAADLARRALADGNFPVGMAAVSLAVQFVRIARTQQKITFRPARSPSPLHSLCEHLLELGRDYETTDRDVSAHAEPDSNGYAG